MSYSEASKRATQKWRKTNRERIYLEVPKEEKQKLKAMAKAKGLSLSRFLLNIIREKNYEE